MCVQPPQAEQRVAAGLACSQHSHVNSMHCAPLPSPLRTGWKILQNIVESGDPGQEPGDGASHLPKPSNALQSAP